MMAPSGLYRIPRSDLARQRTEVERFAVLEYGGPTIAWKAPTAAAPVLERRPVFSALLARIRAWSAVKAAPRATPEPEHAAYQLADGGTHESPHAHRVRAELDVPFQTEPAGMHALHPTADEELCECTP